MVLSKLDSVKADRHIIEARLLVCQCPIQYRGLSKALFVMDKIIHLYGN